MFKILNQSLFAKIGFTVLTATVLLLFSLFYFLAYRVVEADNAAKAVTAHLTAQAVLDKIDRNFYERFGDVQAFAYNTLARQTLDSGAAFPDIQAFINTMTTYYVVYDLMMICDLEGKALVTNTIDKAGVPIRTERLFARTFANEEWFRVCLSEQGPAGGAWYSQFITNPDVAKIYGNKGYGMAFAAPVKDAGGKTIGVWYNFAAWKEITQAIRTEAEAELRRSDPGAFIILTDKTGKIIDVSDERLIRNEVKADEESLNSPGAYLTINDQKHFMGNYVHSWATARGAYTYQGNNWKAATLLTQANITWATFLSDDLLPVMLISILLVGGIGAYVYFYFRREIIHRINQVKQILEDLARGELPPVAGELVNQNEIGQMVGSLTRMIDSLKRKSVFSDEIAQGNLFAELAGLSQQDVLGNSLVNMRDKLRQIAEKDKERNWTTEGLSRFSDILRASEDLEKLCNHLLGELVIYLQAHQGVLFICQADEQNQVWLELMACYAFDRRKYPDHRKILSGEDLTGQAFLEGEIIHLTEVPREYVRINSGIVDAIPSSVLIVPLKINGQVEGVMEIASLRKYQPFEIEFIVKLAENIASTLVSAKMNARTRRLLESSQQQTEELKAQEEEMRQNMEELQATQEEVQRNEQEYKLQIRQLETAIAELEGRLNPQQ